MYALNAGPRSLATCGQILRESLVSSCFGIFATKSLSSSVKFVGWSYEKMSRG